MSNLVLISGIIIAAFIGLLGLVVIWKVFKNEIDLRFLISDENGEASLSRFQFLIFTFVIAMSLFLLVASSVSDCDPCKAKFPEIPQGVWALLGISGGSYVVSKAINRKKGEGTGNGDAAPGGKDDGDKGKEKKPKDPAAGEQMPA